MYVPPYEALLGALGTSRAAAEAAGRITVPTALFRMLLQIAVAESDFDEDAYLAANPDVAEAVRKREIESGLAHYVGFGYFEGRRGGIGFDAKWYVETYSDIAEAVTKGQVGSAEEHFRATGGGEGRYPIPAERASAAEWKRVLICT